MGGAVESDRYTAPAGAVRTRARGRPATLVDGLREFLRQPSPPYLLGAVAIALALRLAQGNWSWRDGVMAVGLVAITPFVEWLIQVYLLHSPPINLRGRGV